MNDKLWIVDADRHVIEPYDMWRQYLAGKWHSSLPYMGPLSEDNRKEIETILKKHGSDISALPAYMLEGKPLFYKWNDNISIQVEAALKAQKFGYLIQDATSPERQIIRMNEAHIQWPYLFPTYATFIVNSEHVNPPLSCAYASAYNRWLFDYCALSTDRLKGVGLISRHDPAEMIQELYRIVEFGWHAVVLRPEKILGRTLGHADYNRFWHCCEEMGVAVVIHGGSHLQASTLGSDRFDTHFALHACSHPMEAQAAFLALLEGGVLHRHARLRFAFLEAGASWLPYWLWRLDHVCYEAMPLELEHTIKMKPSEYFRRQCWIGFEIDEPCLKEVGEWVGADKMLFGTDFPHPDHIHFNYEKIGVEGVSENQMKEILSANPLKFFGW